MDHNYSAKYGSVLLRPLCHDDIESLRVWRNNLEETRFLRPVGIISPEKQEQWFQNYLLDPREITFAIVETKELNRLVGSVSIYEIEGDRAEFGKIRIGDPAAHGRGIGRMATVLALAVGFERLGLHRITACVHRENIAARSNDLRIGFRIVGEQASVVGGYEDVIEIDHDTLYSVNGYAKGIEFGEWKNNL